MPRVSSKTVENCVDFCVKAETRVASRTGHGRSRGVIDVRRSRTSVRIWLVTFIALTIAIVLCDPFRGFGITGMSIFPVAGAAPAPSCRTDLARFLEKLKVPGLAAAIVKDGELVCAEGVGMANIEQRRPVTEDTLFLIASVSKTITATALMQLSETGALRLDDDINAYLPFDITLPGFGASAISFRQLLTHTASIRDNDKFIDNAVTMGADSPISLGSLTRGYLASDGPFYNAKKNFERSAPGTKNKYSNMGITLAGYLVEVISGVPFDVYCREKIFAPLGMDQTSWRLAEVDRSILAVPYDRRSSGFVAYEQYGEPNYPDGMLRTSVSELAKFLIATMQGGSFKGRQILQPTTIDEMLTRQTKLDKSQGLVWFKEKIGGRTVWGHDGSDDGASATMWFDRKRDLGVILMANGEWKGEEKLFKRLFEEADGY
jgi:CubicO group peptidase (beta-lactamase class C family)